MNYPSWMQSDKATCYIFMCKTTGNTVFLFSRLHHGFFKSFVTSKLLVCLPLSDMRSCSMKYTLEEFLFAIDLEQRMGLRMCLVCYMQKPTVSKDICRRKGNVVPFDSDYGDAWNIRTLNRRDYARSHSRILGISFTNSIGNSPRTTTPTTLPVNVCKCTSYTLKITNHGYIFVRGFSDSVMILSFIPVSSLRKSLNLQNIC